MKPKLNTTFRFESNVFIALALALLASACSGNPVVDNQEISEITYAIPITIAAIPSYVAYDQGFWEDQGLIVNLKFFDSGRQALEALLANEAELMSVSEVPPMYSVLQGHSIYWVGTVVEHREAKLTYRTEGISSPEDMIGKNVATFPGTNSDYYMYLWFENYGIDIKDVNIVSLRPPEMVQAFVQGEIDAFFAWEPYNYNAYSRLSTSSENWPTELYEGRHSLIMNQDFANANPDIVEKLLKGLYQAEIYIHEHPEESKDIVARVIDMDRSVLDSLWDEYTVRIELDNNLLTILNSEAEWAIQTQGFSGPVPNFSDYIFAQALEKILPDRVGSEFK